MPERLTPAEGDLRVNAVLVTVDPSTGRAAAIERIQLPHRSVSAGTVKLLTGDQPALSVRYAARAEVERLIAGGVMPTLALVSVGEDPASQIYLKKKSAACAEAGIAIRRVALAAGADTRAVVERVRALGADPDVHGILVQLPLGPQVNAQAVLESIPPARDVDGFHPENVGRLGLGLPCLMPCTPRGILELLRYHQVPLAGKHAVVLGRSPIVGRPLATLLSLKGLDCTVTIGHSASGPALRALAREADLLIAAIGRPEFVTGDWVKSGATVVDVGIHRVPDPTRRGGSRITGDVEFESVAAVAGALSPVPGGVGPMTVAMVVANTVLAAERQAGGVRV
ncbi:MAG: bifunctional 5,10-methylene-tetrahydrofolate dehydrogenase/5,10-methylene-tetrahydrofolate cyclohydrolase [Candidatus Eisenbacteria bacterium]|nr:bifunctional 5,10-methylene-tetrahydrofolate dehydrogenase/5,10-methylene-tetrahydrofolate cyclohydrolase [Candidatus Eisenbacteria bacterium]